MATNSLKILIKNCDQTAANGSMVAVDGLQGVSVSYAIVHLTIYRLVIISRSFMLFKSQCATSCWRPIAT